MSSPSSLQGCQTASRLICQDEALLLGNGGKGKRFASQISMDIKPPISKVE
ncbi:MAG: hypothetical protein H6875_07945 [Hyphomicrobiaceae bacterium]|nr:hypothetical protein [Hyphomicrobiaceae bacterium]